MMKIKLRAEQVSEQLLRRFMFRNDRLNYSFCVYPDASKLQYDTAVDSEYDFTSNFTLYRACSTGTTIRLFTYCP
jgi:hypothetical protein